MATVPTYDQFQVSQSVKPLTPVSSPDFQNHAAERIQKQGQAMQQAGSAISKIETDMQNTANNTRIKDADRQLVELDQQLEYGKAGYTNLRGKNALERPDKKSLVDEYGKQFDDAAAKISKGLGNDAQRQAFAEVTARRRASLSDRIMQHVNKESRDYTIGVQEGTIKVARDQMALSWGDKYVVAGAASQARDARRELGKLSGQSDKQIQAGIIDELSPAHAAVISSAIDAGKMDYAKAYLKANNAELTPGAKIHMTELVKTGEVLGKAQNKADSIMASGVSDREKLAAARDLTDPKQREKTVSLVKGRISENRALDAQVKADHYDKAADLADNGQDIPASLRVGLSPGQRTSLDNLHAKRVSGEPIQTNEVAYGEFSLMPTVELAKMTPQQYHEKYRALFDDSHYEGGLNLIRAARGAVATDAKQESNRENHRSILSFDSAFKAVAAESGVIGTGGVKKMSSDDFKAWGAMRQEAAHRVSVLEGNTHKKATSEEMLKISRQVLADKVYLDQWGTDPQVPFSGVSTDHQGEAYVLSGGKEVKLSSVPFDIRMQITDAFHSKQGREPTQQEIVDTWLKYKGGK